MVRAFFCVKVKDILKNEKQKKNEENGTERTQYLLLL